MYVFIASLLIVGYCSFEGINVRFLHYEFYAIFFGIIILNLTSNGKLKNVFRMESPKLPRKDFLWIIHVSYDRNCIIY